MSSTTPRVGFYMPADDGSEPVNVATDLNDNLERMDTAVGFVAATSGADPINLYDGKAVYETDTGRAKFRKSGVWNYILNAGASFLSHLYLDAAYRIGLGVASPLARLDIHVTDIWAFPVIKLKQISEVTHRFEMNADGLRWGGGSVAPDVRLYRPGAGQLALVGSVSMGSTLSVTGALSAASADISGDLDVGGHITSDANIDGKLSGTGYNVPNIIRKTSDTARTNNTAADDPQLTFNAEANSTYFIQLFLIYSGSTTGDLKIAWTVPSGAAGIRWVLGEAVGGTDFATTTMRTSAHLPGTEVPIGAHTTGLFNGAQDTCILTTGVTAGAVTLKWAQNTTDGANATTVRSGSILLYRKVE